LPDQIFITATKPQYVPEFMPSGRQPSTELSTAFVDNAQVLLQEAQDALNRVSIRQVPGNDGRP
jgi:hypothetical protein